MSCICLPVWHTGSPAGLSRVAERAGGEGGGDMKPGLNGSSVQQQHQHLVVD